MDLRTSRRRASNADAAARKIQPRFRRAARASPDANVDAAASASAAQHRAVLPRYRGTACQRVGARASRAFRFAIAPPQAVGWRATRHLAGAGPNAPTIGLSRRIGRVYLASLA